MCKSCVQEDFLNYQNKVLNANQTSGSNAVQGVNAVADIYGTKPPKPDSKKGNPDKKDTYKPKPANKSNDAFAGQFDFTGGIDGMQRALREQMGGKQYIPLTESGSIYLIPGENLDAGVLCGTNCFAVGTGSKRFLIDACKKDHDTFLRNIACFVEEQQCYFEAIFITHAHYDHMDGAMNLVELMQSMDLPEPKVYKFIDGNPSEVARLENNPGLEKHLFHTKEGDNYSLEDIEFMPVETPGHLSDHLCYLMKETKNGVGKYHLFTGDSIIGATSTFFMDYPKYFQSLIKTREIITKYDIELLYVAHSLTLRPESIALPAKKKVDEYISRRTVRDHQIERVAFLLARGNLGKFTITEYYDLQNSMNKKELKSESENYFKYMLDKQIKKLVVDGKFFYREKQYWINNEYYHAEMTYSKL